MNGSAVALRRRTRKRRVRHLGAGSALIIWNTARQAFGKKSRVSCTLSSEVSGDATGIGESRANLGGL